MSINLVTGLWRCFKTSNRGNFVKLVSILEQCSYRKAYEKFVFETILEPESVNEPEVIEVLGPNDTSTFTKLNINEDPKDIVEVEAINLIIKRGVKDYPWYVSKEGFYASRLIIPYLKDNGEMFYFQARALFNWSDPKYLNCKKIKSNNILYPYDYDSTEPLYITEGVFDCLSLKQCGLNSTTTLSCSVSDSQMEQLRFYPGPLVVAYDQDGAGKKGVRSFLSKAYKHKRDDLFYTQIKGTNLKDWNDMYTTLGQEETRVIASNIKQLDFMELTLNEL